MPPQAAAPQTLPADFFSKVPPDTLPANFEFSSGEPKGEQVPGSHGFFLDLAHRMLQNNPITVGKAMLGAGGIVQGETPQEFKWSDVHPSMRNAVKATAEELKRLWPNAGTGVGNLLTLLQTLKAPNVGEVGIAAPFAGQARSAAAVRPGASALTPAEAAEGSNWREPENLAPSPLAAQSQAQIPAQQQPRSYPEGVQPRPTDRAEILDDKAVQERMRQDMGLQAYRNARIAGQERAPAPKWQLAAQAKADAVRAQAEAEAQQILADAEKAATTPAKFTKTVTPKAAAAGKAQPVAEDLSSPNRLIDLMQQSIDALNARKGK